MSHLRHLLIIVVVPALILTVFAVSSTLARGPEGKSTVCHFTPNHYQEITVNDHALQAHMNHGDVLTDEYGDCP